MAHKWVVVVTDGDADFTEVYELEGVETYEQAQAFEQTLPEDSGDYFFRVHRVESFSGTSKATC